jgi:hypothetical protein
MKVTDAVFAHQASGFLSYAQPTALQPVVCVDAVVFASGHDTLLISRLPALCDTIEMAACCMAI